VFVRNDSMMVIASSLLARAAETLPRARSTRAMPQKLPLLPVDLDRPPQDKGLIEILQRFGLFSAQSVRFASLLEGKGLSSAISEFDLNFPGALVGFHRLFQITLNCQGRSKVGENVREFEWMWLDTSRLLEITDRCWEKSPSTSRKLAHDARAARL